MARPMLVPLIVACALFMENTDSTVIATSLPAIALDLGEDPIALKLALTSYLVSLAVFIPISGWMADRFGAKTIFRLAMAVFMLGSIGCAFSHSLETFVLARFFQGMGGAMMVPVGRLVLLRSVPRNQMVQALAYLSIPAMLGPVFGPPLGGFITTYFHWQWIFFINIPIGIAGILLATAFFENIREEDVPPLDVTGALLSAVGLSLVMFGLATGGRHLVSPVISAGATIIGALAIASYVWHAKRTPHPVLDFALLSIPTFRIGVLAGFLFRIGIGAIPFLLPLMLQLGFGLDPLHSGLITFASAVGALFMKTLAAQILRRYGFRRVMTVNAVIGSIFLVIQGFFTADMPYLLMLGLLLVGGCFRSLQFTGLNALMFSDVSKRSMSLATSFSSVAQQLSLSCGVAIGAFVLEMVSSRHPATGIVASDFWPAFLTVALISASSLFVLLRLSPHAGAEVSGHVDPRKATAGSIEEQRQPAE
ncbi:EmrB/QacA subfamily drug resistance transporter [Hyphomicrobiales bacterium]|nr:EmrB/QacA subfamily drug resistance transporter [Hyphomicrobiales bacterium]CAH1665461.1 EmrB/QacA subfamily drug resistance transporter [Hyphomicrobiales bacterium]